MESTPDEIKAWQRMQGLYDAGYYQSEGSEHVELTGPSDRERLKTGYPGGPLFPSTPGKHPEANVGIDYRGYEKHGYTTLDCCFCYRPTVHAPVATYNTGNPVYHCTVCCKCHLCLMSPVGQERLHAAVMEVGGRLAAPPENPTFCEDCGAMLRCGVCLTSGPGGYCQTCGKKEDVTGRCSDCWNGE